MVHPGVGGQCSIGSHRGEVCVLTLQAEGRNLNVSVDVETIVLAGQNHTAVVHQSHIKALGVFHLALQCRDQLTVLGEDSQVEVVVVVSDGDLPGSVDPNSNRIVGDAFAANLSQEISLVVENFDAVRPVVANEDLLSVVDDDTIRELQVFGAAKLV